MMTNTMNQGHMQNVRWRGYRCRTQWNAASKTCALKSNKAVKTRALKDGDSERRKETQNDSEVLNFRNKLRSRYLKDKLHDAVEGMKKACDKEPTSKDCAIAWEEVEELQLAAERKIKPVEADELAVSSKSEAYDVFEEVDNSVDNTQEKLQKKDLLSDVQPCDIIQCEEPGGTLLAAGKLEQTLNVKTNTKKSEKRKSELKQDLQMAISDAFDACGDGSKEECTAAWEKVDELSVELDKEDEL